MSLRKWSIEDSVKTGSNRVVPRSLALAPDRVGVFLFAQHKLLKGGGSVESDLSDLELLLMCLYLKESGMKGPSLAEFES